MTFSELMQSLVNVSVFMNCVVITELYCLYWTIKIRQTMKAWEVLSRESTSKVCGEAFSWLPANEWQWEEDGEKMCHLLWGQHQEKNKLLLPWLWCWTMCRTLLSHVSSTLKSVKVMLRSSTELFYWCNASLFFEL